MTHPVSGGAGTVVVEASGTATARTPRVAFVMEQTLGHRTHSANVEAALAGQSRLEPVWLPVDWEPSGRVANLPVLGRNWTVRAGLEARRLLRRAHRDRALDAVFVHTQVPAMLLGSWATRVPTVVSLDATPRQYDELGTFYQHRVGRPWVERLKWRIHRRSLSRAASLVTWSEWAKRGLVEEYDVPASKVTVLSPGVRVARWARPAGERPPAEPVRILFVGGDLERKGGTALIEAFRRVRSRLDGTDARVELHLVTQSEVVDEPDVVVHRGLEPNSDALVSLYHRAHVFCLPTLGDCLPMVLSEAGAAGLPLISTDVGAIPEIVRDGETGVLVPPGDVDALAAALERLVRDAGLRDHLGTTAAALVARDHDADANTRRLVEVLSKVADGTAAGDRSAPPATITVSGTIDPRRSEQEATGARPRADYAELARELGGARILDRRAVRARGGVFGRLLERFAGADVAMAWVCARDRRRGGILLTDGEQVGLPFALFCRVLGRRRVRHTMIVHRISTPKKAWPFRLLGLDRHVDTYLTYATAQTEALLGLGVRRDAIVQSSFMVDTGFFAPERASPAPTGRPMICAVGLERRDYRTLVDAVRGLELEVVIAAASPWSTRSDRTGELELPSNVRVCALDQQELRDLYARCRFLVMPLDDVDFQAGVTALLEAMSMRRAVVCTRTVGQTDLVEDRVTGVYVPPGDAVALRRAIEELLADPERAQRMGEAARRHVVERCDVAIYARRVARAASGERDPGGRLAVSFVTEQHLGHATYSANLRAALARHDDLDQAWIDVEYASSGRWWERLPLPGALRAAARARREIRGGWDAEPDVAFFNTQVPAVLADRRVRRAPHVLALDVTPRQYDAVASEYGHRPDRPGPVRWLKHRRNVAVLSGAGTLVAWSGWVRDSLVAEYGVSPDRVRVVPPGVDLDRWRPPTSRVRPVGRPARILFVGGDFHRKGGDVLIEAFRRLPEGLAELVLVTREPVEPGPGITVARGLTPNSAELVELYHSSDVAALPARAEAFGIAAVEAAAAGLPIVSTGVGGLADIVVAGETGLVVDPGDVDGLAAALRRLAEDPELRERLGRGARRRAEERFDATSNADTVAAILREVAADGDRRPRRTGLREGPGAAR